VYILFEISESVLGSHDNAVRCVEYSNEVNVVLSGGWDGNVKMWDTRSSQCVGTLPQPDKVNTLFIFIMY
jgi:cell cycle arrest protein BUB3